MQSTVAVSWKCHLFVGGGAKLVKLGELVLPGMGLKDVIGGC